MPSFFKAITALWALLLATGIYAAQQDEDKPEPQSNDKPAIIKAYSVSAHGSPQYSHGFTHFDYVNPNAPKGGELRLATTGTFDNFNMFAQRGDSATEGFEIYETLVFDSLMVPSGDEAGILYPLIAESVEYPEDKSWVVFTINPAARHQNGTSITAEDVAFTFHKFFEEGVPFIKQSYQHVAAVEVLDAHRIKFSFAEDGRELLIKVATFPVFSKEYWKDKNLSEPITEPLMGSGPYSVSTYNMGSSVTYKLHKDYWAKDLPTRKGLFNFEYITWDYYRDNSVSFEAFKAGEYDFRRESTASLWAEGYNVAAVKNNQIIRQVVKHETPPHIQSFIFNIEREQLKDRRVRQALNLLFDFEWFNKNLFYGQYARINSYFEGTPYKATGKPEGKELELLNQFKGQLPVEVFGDVWRPNVTDGSGRLRQEMRAAITLLKEAGWELVDQKMVRKADGQPLEFEVLLYSPSFERIVLPYKENLKKIGVTLNVRIVDSTQFQNRMRSRDFDMIVHSFLAQHYPDTSMRLDWHSDYRDSTHNQTGVNDPVIDYLIEGIAKNQENEELLRAYAHAFDRVALWNFYIIPQWYSNTYRLAYWNKFSMPDVNPKLRIGIESWWYDAEKAKTLK